MKLSEFDYVLPEELIAQYPSKARGDDKLLVLYRAKNFFEERAFTNIVDYFGKGDLLVLNNTKVIPARLFGKRETGGSVEIFIVDRTKRPVEALVRPSGRIKENESIILESGNKVKVQGKTEIGRLVEFDRDVDEVLKKCGHIPLPPYISRRDVPSDIERYQTIYAKHEGATASPTAGLHFTKEILKHLSKIGVQISYLTLHTNYGTFAPVKTDDVEKYKMHREYFELPAETARAVAKTKKNGGKVFAVGTTTTRALEHCASLSLRGVRHLRWRTTKQSQEIASLTSFARNDNGFNGYTDMFIYPGYKFRIVDHLITNFHLPKSTLLLLTSAFCGKELLFRAYGYAIANRFRFFSYGDAMLIL